MTFTLPDGDEFPLLQLVLPVELLVGDVLVVLVRLDDEDEVDDDLGDDGQEAEGGGGHGQVPAQLPVESDLGDGDVVVQEADHFVHQSRVDGDGHGQGDQGQNPSVQVAWMKEKKV